jgi:hypothetical protein
MGKVVEGFFWGLGFAVSSLCVLLIYTFTVHSEVEISHQKALQDTLYYELSSFVEAMDIEILEIKLVEEQIVVASKMKNLGETPLNLGYAIRYSLFDYTNEFIGNCEGDFPRVNADEEFLYLTTLCDTKFYSTTEIANATISVVRG